MARHRNVRTMNFDEDYEGYNDVYGHSMEDDYCVSPSASHYLYDRSKPTQISSFLKAGEDIAEELDDDDDDEAMSEARTASLTEKTRKRLDSLTLEQVVADLVPEEEVLLKSCLDEIRNVVGDSIPDPLIISHILDSKFNVEKALDACLTGASAPRLPTFEPVRRSGTEKKDGFTKDERRSEAGPSTGLPFPQPQDHGSKGLGINSGNSRFKGPTHVQGQASRGKAEPLKVVPASKVSVTVGFELPNKEHFRDKDRFDRDTLSTPTSQTTSGSNSKSSSKAPSPVPPFEDTKKEEQTKTPSKGIKEFKPDVAVSEYNKERGSTKALLNLLVIGHVDAGKSTLMGHLLWQLGQVSKKTMHRFETESKKIGKQSFLYAWVLDESGEERARGITMDVGQSKFETATKSIVLLDAPGHKDFIPNMITGASQADVAMLVVDSTKGEFETGFESGGQTREHALLVRSLGVTQLIIAVNKLDTVSWVHSRFEEISVRLTTFLVKQAGFRESDLTFVPCSGLVGENLTKKSDESLLTSWYKGPTLLDAIDSFKAPERPIGKPLRITVNDLFKGPGGLCVGGRVETGMVQAGDKVVVQPVGEIATIKSIVIEEGMGTRAFAGDPVLVTLQGLSDASTISIGFVLSDPAFPCRVSSKFQARIVTFEAMTIPLTRGFTGVMHLGSLSEQVVVKRLLSQLSKGTGEVIKEKPRVLPKNSNGIIELETPRPICIEEFKDVKELGRFTLRYAGVTIAAGVITLVN